MPALVPVIDIAPWRHGDPAARAAVAREIDAACRSTGFLQLAGHSIDADVSGGLLAAMDAFFALPLPEKLAVRPSAAEINRGYAPVGAESLSYSLGLETPPDLFEAFNVGPHDVPYDDPVYAAERDGVFAPNVWPAGTAEFEAAVTRYFEAVRRQAHEVTDIFAAALGLEDGYFQPYTTHSTDVLRLNHYVVGAAEVAHGAPRLGMGAHTDYGIVTLLLADDVPGLEILGPDGQWTGVRPEPGNLLVNLGDLTANWTNDHWRSTLHRVLPPPPGTRRRSAAFFHDGNYDALVSCLPTCTSVDDPPRYAPITAGDHVKAKLLGPRTLTSSRAVQTVGGRLD